MYNRVHYCGTLLLLFTLIYFVRVVFTDIFEDNSDQVDEWLDQNDLGDYKKLFREYGKSPLSFHGKHPMFSVTYSPTFDTVLK